MTTGVVGRNVDKAPDICYTMDDMSRKLRLLERRFEALEEQIREERMVQRQAFLMWVRWVERLEGLESK